jgi:hypothetical protein
MGGPSNGMSTLSAFLLILITCLWSVNWFSEVCKQLLNTFDVTLMGFHLALPGELARIFCQPLFYLSDQPDYYQGDDQWLKDIVEAEGEHPFVRTVAALLHATIVSLKRVQGERVLDLFLLGNSASSRALAGDDQKPLGEKEWLIITDVEQGKVKQTTGSIRRKEATMGASGWVYYIPYQDDLEQAFHTLRQQVFESKRYFAWGEVLEYEHAKEALCMEHGVDPCDEEAVEKLVHAVGPIQITEARSIEELLQKPDDGQGTHSILDIPHFSLHYEGIPIAEDIIKQVCEDQRPTREMVEAIVLQEAIWSRLRAWIGLNISCLAWEPRQHRIFEFSEEVLQFLTQERSPQELADALVAHEEMWRAIARCVRFEIQLLVSSSMQGRMLPFPTKDLLRFFGTEKPTKQQVEEAFAQGEVYNIIHCWMGYYAVIYQDDLPSEIVFVGCSGD